MKKIFAFAAVAAISMTAVTGSAFAGQAKNPAEFADMLHNIQVKQSQQRAALYGKMHHKSPADFQEMIEKIQQRQAEQRATIYAK